ncbi:hypothetical protein Micbo1qcDRAFT_8816 [Microdochium bolleyi]|uniref:Uncharacterized protein n=1 Tax=Microdochium bolleyi TaxID=196109 RepID=A0A136JKC2_9PEZI|nr:hypothetical protein Micbo1qcDRAFT_8816 [Microdochium bolleyi]
MWVMYFVLRTAMAYRSAGLLRDCRTVVHSNLGSRFEFAVFERAMTTRQRYDIYEIGESGCFLNYYARYILKQFFPHPPNSGEESPVLGNHTMSLQRGTNAEQRPRGAAEVMRVRFHAEVHHAEACSSTRVYLLEHRPGATAKSRGPLAEHDRNKGPVGPTKA